MNITPETISVMW